MSNAKTAVFELPNVQMVHDRPKTAVDKINRY